ncbi:MAG: AAA family ATPase [Betaproteobacteria bacterium]|nr:AAA family ATPase [Betaproteobacteria bacterium]
MFSINPSLPRDDWLRAGMAAKAAGLALEDFTDWSANGGNYAGPKDCASVWQSFKGDGIGPGTLFHLAFSHGWKDTARKKRQPSQPRQKSPQRAQPDAAALWEQCEPAGPQQGYIVAKRGNPQGLRQVPAGSSLRIARQDVSGWLVVPCRTLAGELQTLQFIPPPGAGKKLNLAGASFGDGLHIVGELADAACCYVVEGIGQAWACWQATGQPAAVCFGAGRMGTVVNAIKAHAPALPLVLVPDTGKEAQAEAIAREHGCQVVRMPADKPANYDANDHAAEFGADALEVLLSRPAEPERRYKLASAGDLSELPPMRWLVRGVLPAQGLAAVYGPPGSGKSFLVLDLAAAVAEGTRWFGYTVKATSVVYVGLEGEGGLSQRVQAWGKHHGKKLPDRLRFVVAQPFDLLESADLEELAEAITAACGTGSLLVVDTLNRAAPSADENSSEDMGRIIEAAKRLQIAIAGLVLLVHHAGKDVTKGMRGHSSLLAAIDTALEVKRQGDSREWKIAKAKDAADSEAVGFKLEPVTLGLDEDRLPITSCVVVASERSMPVQIRAPQGGNQRIVFDALVDLIEHEGNSAAPKAPPGRRSVTVAQAIETCRNRLIDVEPKRQPERVRDALTRLQAAGYIRSEEGWIWLL